MTGLGLCAIIPTIESEENMKLNIKEIKYIRQSLEHRLKYYEEKPDRFKTFIDELKPIIKKFIKLEGDNYIDVNEINNKLKARDNDTTRI